MRVLRWVGPQTIAPVTGTVAVTLANATSSASGGTGPAGTSAQTLDDFTSTASGRFGEASPGGSWIPAETLPPVVLERKPRKYATHRRWTLTVHRTFVQKAVTASRAGRPFDTIRTVDNFTRAHHHMRRRTHIDRRAEQRHHRPDSAHAWIAHRVIADNAELAVILAATLRSKS